jgi:uncharacterized protein YecE (DUF72 family)
MEFGRNEVVLNDIDFTLPPDSAGTLHTLSSSANDGTFKAYVGGTKWADKMLIGKIYPKGTEPAAFLSLYAKSFNTIEFGPTFYMTQPPNKLAEWIAQIESNKDFKFSPKFTQSISHIRKLTNVAELTKGFYDSLPGFGSHLGQLLLQLGEAFSPKNYNQLASYLKSLNDTEKVALEVRNKNWFGDPVSRAALFDLLRKTNVGTVISDTAGRRDVVHMELTTPVAYIRFAGNGLHQTDYSRIDSWVERLRVWKELGLKSVWFYIHQDNERHTVNLADYLIQKMNNNLNINLQRPAILSPSEY